MNCSKDKNSRNLSRTNITFYQHVITVYERVDVKTVRYTCPQRVLKVAFIYPLLLYSRMWGVNVVHIWEFLFLKFADTVEIQARIWV